LGREIQWGWGGVAYAGVVGWATCQPIACTEARKVWRLFRELQIEGDADAVDRLALIQQLLICDFRIGNFCESLGEENS